MIWNKVKPKVLKKRRTASKEFFRIAGRETERIAVILTLKEKRMILTRKKIPSPEERLIS